MKFLVQADLENLVAKYLGRVFRDDMGRHSP